LGRFLRWLADERGNVAPVMAILIVPIIGAFAIGGETSSWYMLHRSQQNAADSSVTSYAISKGSTSEAQAVATQYGYTNGSNNVTITPQTVTCPAGASVISGSTCYQVTVARNVPVYLGRVVGSGSTKNISASAIAGTVAGTNPFCLIGLSSLKLGGGPNTNLTGCNLMSGSGGMQCSGTNSATGVQDAYTAGTFQGQASNCGPTDVANYSGFPGDPFASQVNTALGNLSCTYTAGGTISSLSNPGGANCYTGTVKLSQDITVTSNNTVLVVKTDPSGNGGLNLNGHTLSTSGSGTLTVVFTGSTALNSTIMPSTGGTLNIAAPTGGDWAGMTIVEDPAMPYTTYQGQNYGLDLSFSGGSNAITLDVSGRIYAPNATFNINGSIDMASNGYRCITIVANIINATGTNSIFSDPTSQCNYYGGNQPPKIPMVALLQ
jgi:Flp pilus assembly protein TadG